MEDRTLTDEEWAVAGQRLREIREATIGAQDVLARLAKVSVKTISIIEHGKGRPRSGTLRGIIGALPPEYEEEFVELFHLPRINPRSGAITGRAESTDEADLREAVRRLEGRVAELERERENRP